MTTPSLARHYEQLAFDRAIREGRALAEALDFNLGDSLLELNCGAGVLTDILAKMVGMRGDVLGLDPLALRISMAQQISRRNLRFQVGSPTDLRRFPAGCFHAIVFASGFHKLADKATPLAELRRILKPGGRLGIVTPSADRPHPVDAVKKLVFGRAPFSAHPLPAEAEEFPVGQGELATLLDGAGFAGYTIDALPDVAVYASADAAIEAAQARSWGRFLDHLPPHLHFSAREEIRAGLERLRLVEGIRHDGLTLQAVAVAPGQAEPPAALG
ncbi:class I SAM-dependent methyltransferase [Derxia gummosa]|uniref:Class I SAM-dependent methyltransferase n=1 Tax=Derxia gummosa DSM 723 TaxID=1121388 RepID=A0A8B6X9S5_9BURK|nr:methyltransferase domain-containing protein [Derxia gummosa]